MPLQFINGADGKPAFVVIPFDEFSRGEPAPAAETAPLSPESLLSTDGRFVGLPHGGPGAQIDLRQFIDAWVRRGTTVMAINKRQQAYSKFVGDGRNALDPILRRCFLPIGSPYANSMQATTAVVDALAQTDVFERTTEAQDGYYRPVQCIRINEAKAIEYLRTHGEPEHAIDLDHFMLQ